MTAPPDRRIDDPQNFDPSPFRSNDPTLSGSFRYVRLAIFAIRETLNIGVSTVLLGVVIAIVTGWLPFPLLTAMQTIIANQHTIMNQQRAAQVADQDLQRGLQTAQDGQQRLTRVVVVAFKVLCENSATSNAALRNCANIRE